MVQVTPDRIYAKAASVSAPVDAQAIGATTAMRVADELRKRILNGEFVPEQRLKLEDIAAALEVSHMPVRAALYELESEGILDVFPRRGAVIRAVDARFIRNFFDLRAAVEGMLTERCAQRIDARGVALLRESAAAYDAAGKARNAAEMVASNLKLHALINDTADNPEAVQVLSRGRLLVQALRMRYGFGFDRAERVGSEHRLLIDAIEEHDVIRAGVLARQHCENARDDLLSVFER